MGKSSAPVRVLELVSGLATESTSGGVARLVTELVRALDRSRVQPFVAALWDYNTPYERTRVENLCALDIPTLLAAPWDEARPYRSCVTGLSILWRKLSQRVDIIHSHGEFSDWAAVALKRRLGARYLVRTVHNEREWSKRPLFGKLFPNLLYPWFFDVDLAISQRAASNLDRRPLAGLLRKKVVYIPNALDFTRVSEVQIDRVAKRRSLDLPVDALVIGSIGRLARQKGYDVLLAAAPQVLARCPNAHFVIVGTGVLDLSLREQAHALGIGDNVTFTGARSDAIEVLKSFDLFVSSSRYEGLPTVVLEAIAAGLPVIATRVSGNSELIQDQISGLLVPPEDPTALSHAIIAAATGETRMTEMAKLAAERARAVYSLEAMAMRHADLYCALGQRTLKARSGRIATN